MKTIWTIACNDGLRRLKMPSGLIILLIIPLVMCGLIGAIFSPGKNIMPKIPLLVADEDNGLASRFLIQAFSAGESQKMFEIKTVEKGVGLYAMGSGKASAMLVIPGGFSKNVLSGRPGDIQLIKNPSQEFLPEVAEEFVRSVSIGLSALIWVFFDEIQVDKSFFNLPGNYLKASDLGPFPERARVKAMAVQRVVSPLLISLKKQVIEEKKKGQNLSTFAYLFPGMAVLFLFFIVQTAMADILHEKETGTLKRTLVSPLSEGQYVLGKILGSFLIGFAAYWLMTLSAALLFRLPPGNIPAHLLFCIVAVFFTASFFAAIFAFVRNRNQGAAISTPVILIFGVMGGSMIPIDQFGRQLRAIAHFTPNYWFITGMRTIFSRGVPLVSLVILMVLGFTCFTLAYILLKKKVALA